MKYEKYLPLGTVALLKDAKKRVMITGFRYEVGEDKKVYDYTGCLYPEGYISSDKMLVFNHSDIEKLFCIGLSDDEEKEFKSKLNEYMKNVNNEEK